MLSCCLSPPHNACLSQPAEMHILRVHLLYLCISLIFNHFFLRKGVMVLAADKTLRYHNPYARNEVVKGISLKSLRRRSAIECGLACLDESGCVSFNFGKKSETCELPLDDNCVIL